MTLDAGATVYLTFQLFTLSVFVWGIFRYYTSRRRSSWLERLTLWSSYGLCLSVLLLVPTDMAKCIATPQECAVVNTVTQKVVVWTDWTILWQFYFWSLQFFSWILVPVLRYYAESGQFSMWKKLKEALWSNVIEYVVVGSALVIFVIILAVQKELDGDGIVAICIAMSNSFGIFIVMLLLGYGLVAFPRFLWKAASHEHEINTVAYHAADVSTALDESQVKLENLLGKIQEIDRQVSRRDTDVRVWVDKLVQTAGSYYRSNWRYSSEDASQVDMKSVKYDLPECSKLLAKTRSELKSAIAKYNKNRHRWLHSVEEFKYLEEIVKSQRGERSVLNEAITSETNYLKRSWKQIKLFYNLYLHFWVFRLMSIMAVVLSSLVLWCEVTMFLAQDNFEFSVFSLMLDRSSKDFFTQQFLAIIPILYMGFISYFSMFRLKLFSFYELIPRYSDEGTMLFNAMFVTRFTLPLCFNALMFFHEDTLLNMHVSPPGENLHYETGFSSVFGLVNVVPFLGDDFNIYFPMLLIVLVFCNIFNVWSLCIHWCGGKVFDVSMYETSTQISAGERLLRAGVKSMQSDPEDGELDPMLSSREEVEPQVDEDSENKYESERSRWKSKYQDSEDSLGSKPSSEKQPLRNVRSLSEFLEEKSSSGSRSRPAPPVDDPYSTSIPSRGPLQTLREPNTVSSVKSSSQSSSSTVPVLASPNSSSRPVRSGLRSLMGLRDDDSD